MLHADPTLHHTHGNDERSFRLLIYFSIQGVMSLHTMRTILQFVTQNVLITAFH